MRLENNFKATQFFFFLFWWWWGGVLRDTIGDCAVSIIFVFKTHYIWEVCKNPIRNSQPSKYSFNSASAHHRAFTILSCTHLGVCRRCQETDPYVKVLDGKQNLGVHAPRLL